MFNLQNNLANVNFNTTALGKELPHSCEKQASMNFYIKTWSQDNLSSRNRLFKEALYTLYAIDSFPLNGLRRSPEVTKPQVGTTNSRDNRIEHL